MDKIIFKIVADDLCELSFHGQHGEKAELEIVTRKEMVAGHIHSGDTCLLRFRQGKNPIEPDGFVRIAYDAE